MFNGDNSHVDPSIDSPKPKRAVSEEWQEILPSDDDATPSTISDDAIAGHSSRGPGIPPDAFQTEDWVTRDKQQRLLAFLNYVDPVDNRYGVTKVPPSATWGGDGNLAKVMRFNNELVTVWIPGVVATKWFINLKGEPQNRVHISVQPLRDVDKEASLDLLRRSSPFIEPKAGPIYAGKLMTQWVKGSDKPIVKPFEEFFDATTHFRQKRLMKRLKQSDIGYGDIVLVECNLTRWKTGENKSEAEWVEWKTAFDLISVCLLESAPEGTLLPVFSSAKDTTDVCL
ncbi:hypothetical protein LXA43DRAFT_1098725 [Ganoderma leucocontextum]|nr:hypothetical protein LXA43DRAFT_1098725 [Ganoderma leucocontextum]